MAAATAQPAARASKPVELKEDNGRVWLEGVQGFSFAQKVCSTLAVQAEVLRISGEKMTYEDLVGGSGLAFRVQMYKSGMCPSSPHAMVGYRCVSDAFRPTAFKVYWLSGLKPEDPETAGKVKAARDAVIASVKAGVPVIASSEEDGLIVGYQKGGQEWLMLHPMRDGGHKAYVEAGLPWCIAVADGRQPKVLSDRDTVLAAMKQAIVMWEADSEKYYVGKKAWQEWIDRLSVMAEHPDWIKGDQMGNAWMYDSVVAHRRNAASYLRKYADLFDLSAADHLRKAADLYEREVKEVLLGQDQLPMTVAPYPGDKAPWTQDLRNNQVKRMRQAMELDAQAVQELQLALK